MTQDEKRKFKSRMILGSILLLIGVGLFFIPHPSASKIQKHNIEFIGLITTSVPGIFILSGIAILTGLIDYVIDKLSNKDKKK